MSEDNKIILKVTEENVVTPTTEELEKRLDELKGTTIPLSEFLEKENLELVEVNPSEILDEEEKNDVIFTPEVKEEGNVNEVLEEERELTDEEKHAIFIQQLRDSKIKFRNVKHNGNVTTSQFGSDYRKNRKRKNKQQNKSRKTNR